MKKFVAFCGVSNPGNVPEASRLEVQAQSLKEAVLKVLDIADDLTEIIAFEVK